MDVVTTRLITQRKPAPAVPAVSADLVGAKPQKSTTTTTTSDNNTADSTSISDNGMNDKFQGVSATTTIATSTPTHYDGLWDCVTRITKEEGLQAFFIGR